MTTITTRNPLTHIRAGSLPARAAFALQVSILVLFLLGRPALLGMAGRRRGLSPAA
jgi:hypothetical protein